MAKKTEREKVEAELVGLNKQLADVDGALARADRELAEAADKIGDLHLSGDVDGAAAIEAGIGAVEWRRTGLRSARGKVEASINAALGRLRDAQRQEARQRVEEIEREIDAVLPAYLSGLWEMRQQAGRINRSITELHRLNQQWGVPLRHGNSQVAIGALEGPLIRFEADFPAIFKAAGVPGQLERERTAERNLIP